MISTLRMLTLAGVVLAAAAAVAQDDVAAIDRGETPVQFTAAKVLDGLNAVVRETFSGTLVAVTAADRVTVDRDGTPVRLRLYGVDSPEEDQPYFAQSREAVMDRALNGAVAVHVLAVDSTDMLVGLVFDSEDASLNHWLVSHGFAWWDERNAAKDSLLRRLNAEAVVAQRGLFADPAALAPWDFRSSHELPDFTYTLEAPEPAPRVAAPPPPPGVEEPRSLSARGTMTEDRPRTAAPPAPRAMPNLGQNIGGDINPADLIMRHQPRIATDASGRPLGLTASDVGSIPYATQYGFREGDIISRVNGIAIESEAQIWGLIPQFQNVKNFQVEVLRGGQTVTIPITVN